MLRDYEPPPIDPGIDEALLDFIARRKACLRRFQRLTRTAAGEESAMADELDLNSLNDEELVEPDARRSL